MAKLHTHSNIGDLLCVRHISQPTAQTPKDTDLGFEWELCTHQWCVQSSLHVGLYSRDPSTIFICYHAASNSSVKCYCASSGFDPVPVNPYYDICKPVCIVCRVRSFLCVHVIKGREDLIEWAQPEAQNSNLLHVSTAASEGGATIMQTKPWTCHWLNNTENNAFLILGLSLLCYRCAYVCSAVLGVHSWAYSYCLHQPNLANSLTVAWLHVINESLHWCSMWQLLSKTVIVKYPSLSVCTQSVFFTTLML